MTRRPHDEDRDTLLDGKRTELGVVPTAKPQVDEVDLVGTVVGGYLVEAQIGSGAMGTVYRAKHVDTNRVVALKALHEHHLGEPRAVERFRREARLAARLGHPHVAGVYELIETDGRFSIALELVEGEPLTSIITMPLPPERVMVLAAQILRGLEHAHAMGLVHRDLKPDNVLVEWRNARDHARIVDFGIALAQQGSAESLDRLTATGQVVGTVHYMAPEQALGDVVDERADLYSLGLILYEMIAGVPPYEGRPIDVLGKKLRTDPPSFAERVPTLIVEPMLERFCRKLLARMPEWRFQTAREALNVLRLIETDPRSAGPFLGIMDIEKALDVVTLPPPPTKKRR